MAKLSLFSFLNVDNLSVFDILKIANENYSFLELFGLWVILQAANDQVLLVIWISGADPGFVVRGGVSWRGVWGPSPAGPG